MSTAAAPKPFRRLLGGESLFQQAVRRVADRDFLPPVVVCGRAHRDLAQAQLGAVAAPPWQIVLEPCGRGTAAIAAVAAELARRRHPGALVLMLAADHVIADAAAFRAAVRRGAAVAAERIVLLGIKPTRAEAGYGYIKRGAPLGEDLFEVDAFYEKPDAATAERFVEAGDYSWNASYFLFSPEVLLAEMTASRPDIAAAAIAALPAVVDDSPLLLDAEGFAHCPAEAVDRAVMERTKRAAVVLCDFAWADVGAWDEVWRLSDVDGDGNTLRGDVHLTDVRDSLVWSEGATVAAIGVSDLVIVATEAGVLVAPRARAQEVRAIAEMLNLRVRPPATDTH